MMIHGWAWLLHFVYTLVVDYLSLVCGIYKIGGWTMGYSIRWGSWWIILLWVKIDVGDEILACN